MKILLTGEKGLLGSSIKNQLTCSSLEKRISSYEQFSDFVATNNINTVIHTAAKVGGVKANFENKIDFYLKNSNLNNIVFEASFNNNVKNLVNFSSTCVFPDSCQYPLKEESIFDGPPHFTNDAYAYSKRMMQLLCTEARKHDKNYFTIIPTNLFGFNDNYDLNNGHVVASLIHKCFLAKKNSQDFVIWGSGKPLREFLFADDLARAVKQLLTLDLFPYDSVIISTPQEISIEDCAALIAQKMEFKGRLIFDKDKPDGQFRKPTDTSRFKSILPDFEFTPFESAIENVVHHFSRNYENLRI